MITALYASFLGLLIVWLSLNVIKFRKKHIIRYGDGNNIDLIIARTAHSNATEYIPVALLLLLLLELNHAGIWVIHLLGVSFVLGRLIHAYGILKKNHFGRVTGMKITLFAIIALAILNLAYLPYDKLFDF